MRAFKLSTIVILFFLIAGCNSDQPEQLATSPQQPFPPGAPIAEDDYWAKDNFDLQRVGTLLERADSPEEFERYLNDDDYGVNNLDLNGDGYADYISVEEFGDGDDDSRGLSLFSRFGPDLIQEIATIFFYRDRPDYPGSRIVLLGDDNIYGDNSYYETNWLDRSLQIASFLFSDHDRYASPYYYDNYPSWYSPYQIVETPIYRTRVVELYPEPVFVYTNAVPTYFSNIDIRSPYDGKWMDKIHAKLAKPRKEQAEFIKNNPSRRQFAKEDRGRRERGFGDDKPGRDDPPRSDRGDERGNPGRDDRGAERGNPNRPVDGGNPDRGGNPNRGGGNPKADNPNRGGGNPHAGNPNKGGGNPNKGGGNPNKGGGNPNKGGGNPNKGGGGGKGGGKGKP